VSRAWGEVLQQVGRVATTDTSVLITGESGTGKELIADLVHRRSRRARKPFVVLDCAALHEPLLESELFGHEKGAFTGAVSTRIGRIEQAAGGTLFLDEVAEMSPRVQAKFLRVLEEREFQRLGGQRILRADVRVIAATNRDLATRIAQQAFRADLYYRLDVFRIHAPPLRSRPDDILPLAETFLAEQRRTTGRRTIGIARDACDALVAYSWPGNVRELRNVIERALLFCDGGAIERAHLPDAILRAVSSEVASQQERSSLAAGERGVVERALAEAMGNKTKAARLLGLSRAQFYARLERFGLQ
jgi:transcriptional regulator with PAS, ATPase and Fis domain